MKCFWCNTDPEAARMIHEGPHATWCPRYRTADLAARCYAELGLPVAPAPSCDCRGIVHTCSKVA